MVLPFRIPLLPSFYPIQGKQAASLDWGIHRYNMAEYYNHINIDQHLSQNRILPYLQQRLRKVLRQLPQPRRISGRDYNIFHTNRAPSSLLQKYILKVFLYCGNCSKYFSVIVFSISAFLLGSTSAMHAPLNPAPLKRPP